MALVVPILVGATAFYVSTTDVHPASLHTLGASATTRGRDSLRALCALLLVLHWNRAPQFLFIAGLFFIGAFRKGPRYSWSHWLGLVLLHTYTSSALGTSARVSLLVEVLVALVANFESRLVERTYACCQWTLLFLACYWADSGQM